MIIMGVLALALAVIGILMAFKLRGGFRLAAILVVGASLAICSLIVYSVRNLLFSTDGKYRPLALISVSEVRKDTKWSAGFAHSFKGRYEVGVMVEKLTMEPVVSYDVDLVLEARIYLNDTLQFSSRSEKNVIPFWGIEERGFVFITYEVPRDVPIDQAIRFEVECMQTGSRFVEHYGPRYLFIRKASDK